jgi:hypothetical protein
MSGFRPYMFEPYPRATTEILARRMTLVRFTFHIQLSLHDGALFSARYARSEEQVGIS